MRILGIFCAAAALCGCISDTKQQMAACELDTLKDFPGTTIEVGGQAFNEHIRMCMAAHGYEYRPMEHLTQCGAEGFGRMTVNPLCYIPTNWAERTLFELELTRR